MTIAVIGSERFFEALKNGQNNIQWVLTNEKTLFEKHNDAAAIFCESQPGNLGDYKQLKGPVFINEVINSLPAHKNLFRFNGWPCFIEQETWEICGHIDKAVENILRQLGKKSIVCADEPGFISARIVAMIINEAFLAKAEGVSTAAEIDIAMKLGTNYPYGPFEWANKIGLANIHSLLIKLSETDNRYRPAAGLTEIQLKP